MTDLHEINFDKFKISITRCHVEKRKPRIRQRRVWRTPISIAYFSVAEWIQITNRIQREPLKEVHWFNFSHGRYRLELYDPEETEPLREYDFVPARRDRRRQDSDL